MTFVAVRHAKHLRVSALTSSSLGGVPRSGTLWYSTSLSGGEDDQPSHDNDGPKNEELDYFLGGKPELQLQGVDPKRVWGFCGVHKVVSEQDLV